MAMRLSVYLQDQNRHVRFYLSMHIKQKRESLGISKEDLAQQLRINIGTYSKMESGRLRFNENVFEEIIPLLQINEEDLLEICRISNIAYANEISKELSPNYPA